MKYFIFAIAMTLLAATGMAQTLPTDAGFMKQFASGSLAEVELGKFAAQRTQDREVKEFAQHMVDEHSQANDDLLTLAKEQNVELPAAPDSASLAQQSSLANESGPKFDLAYLEAQVSAHEKTLRLLQYQIDNGQNSSIRQFAQETFWIVSRHLDMARDLQAKVSRGLVSAV